MAAIAVLFSIDGLDIKYHQPPIWADLGVVDDFEIEQIFGSNRALLQITFSYKSSLLH